MPKIKRIKPKIKSKNDFLWLPFDYRLIPPVFSFGHVKGIARIFLEIEIILSVSVVMCAVILLFISLFY